MHSNIVLELSKQKSLLPTLHCHCVSDNMSKEFEHYFIKSRYALSHAPPVAVTVAIASFLGFDTETWMMIMAWSLCQIKPSLSGYIQQQLDSLQMCN